MKLHDLNSPKDRLKELEKLGAILLDLESHPCITDEQRTTLFIELKQIAQEIRELRSFASKGHDS